MQISIFVEDRTFGVNPRKEMFSLRHIQKVLSGQRLSLQCQLRYFRWSLGIAQQLTVYRDRCRCSSHSGSSVRWTELFRVDYFALRMTRTDSSLFCALTTYSIKFTESNRTGFFVEADSRLEQLTNLYQRKGLKSNNLSTVALMQHKF